MASRTVSCPVTGNRPGICDRPLDVVILAVVSGDVDEDLSVSLGSLCPALDVVLFSCSASSSSRQARGSRRRCTFAGAGRSFPWPPWWSGRRRRPRRRSPARSCRRVGPAARPRSAGPAGTSSTSTRIMSGRLDRCSSPGRGGPAGLSSCPLRAWLRSAGSFSDSDLSVPGRRPVRADPWRPAEPPGSRRRPPDRSNDRQTAIVFIFIISMLLRTDLEPGPSTDADAAPAVAGPCPPQHS